MAAQLWNLPLLLLMLLTFQEMMPSEALMCEAPSRFFTGLCFNGKNCAAICDKDGFLSGKCKMFKCICQKDCGGHVGGGGGGAPGEGPPEAGGGGDEGGDAPPEAGGDGGDAGDAPPDAGGDGGDAGDAPPEDGSSEELSVYSRKHLIN